ncbi:hypothetical protein V8C26DRAFT_406465, partial [Trichoderma gracile]
MGNPEAKSTPIFIFMFLFPSHPPSARSLGRRQAEPHLRPGLKLLFNRRQLLLVAVNVELVRVERLLQLFVRLLLRRRSRSSSSSSAVRRRGRPVLVRHHLLLLLLELLEQQAFPPACLLEPLQAGVCDLVGHSTYTHATQVSTQKRKSKITAAALIATVVVANPLRYLRLTFWSFCNNLEGGLFSLLFPLRNLPVRIILCRAKRMIWKVKRYGKGL